jgi:hypothetical protein
MPSSPNGVSRNLTHIVRLSRGRRIDDRHERRPDSELTGARPVAARIVRASADSFGDVIELLLFAGLVALGVLFAVGAVFTLDQRRQGTVRAVSQPVRNSDDQPGGST